MPSSFNFPSGTHYFRGVLQVADDARIASAEIIVTADNLYMFSVNGTPAGEGHPSPDLWHRPKRFDVTALFTAGRNVVAVEAINTATGPAGLLAKLIVECADGRHVELVTNATWMCTDQETAGWDQPGFDDRGWRVPEICGRYGSPPWGMPAPPDECEVSGTSLTEARQQVATPTRGLQEVARHGGGVGPRPVPERVAPADYPWPEAVVFVGDDASLYRPATQTGSSYDSLTVTTFNPNHSRAFPEHDLPAPDQGWSHAPVARSGAGRSDAARAGRCRHRCRSVLRVSRLTGGGCTSPWCRKAKRSSTSTVSPRRAVLPRVSPTGRFTTSTRPKCPTAASCSHRRESAPLKSITIRHRARSSRCKPTAVTFAPLTHTFIFDNEPEILADGRILFIRSDNFFDRGKVETLLHAVHPDGTNGYTEFGLDLGPEYGGRLRAFNVGSPAPLPDGRVAFVTGGSIAVGRPGSPAAQCPADWRGCGRRGGAARRSSALHAVAESARRAHGGWRSQVVQVFSHARLAIVDPSRPDEAPVTLFDSPDGPLHSPVYLGARRRPRLMPSRTTRGRSRRPRATGVLYCSNARHTKNTTAGWRHVRAIRVLAGHGLTVRSSHSYIVHAGSEVTELGTVPLAPDGSFAVEVPADTAIAFQAVDAEGRSELNEMSWIYVRPGEHRGCVGCHHTRQAAPPAATVSLQALRVRALEVARTRASRCAFAATTPP